MKVEIMKLWNKTPGTYTDEPTITAYIPEEKTTDAAVVIFPGGGYGGRAQHEGKEYAEFLAEKGITAFDVAYRVFPNHFPMPLLDARRSVKFVRANAEKFGLDKNKIAVMGSSAGGHLAALVSTYMGQLNMEVEQDEIEKEDFRPNAQVLCYPVIRVTPPHGHVDSGLKLLGDEQLDLIDSVTPDLIADETAPKAFIWHTFGDKGVSPMNSFLYAEKLLEKDVPVEMHIFPYGSHGQGLGLKSQKPEIMHLSIWGELLIRWFKLIGF